MRLLSILILIFLTSCSETATEISVAAIQDIDTSNASCPNLTKDHSGRFVISYIRSVNDSTHEFCYAISNDEGKTFNDPIPVPGSSTIHPHNENLPKVIFKPSGEVIAIWGASNPNPKNKYSGIVYYAQSFDEGKSWSEPRLLVSDTSSIDQRYFDVALLPDGEAGIIWLDNRKTTDKEGSAVFFATTSGKNGFGNEKIISQPACQCCRTDLYIDHLGNYHVLYRGIIKDSIRDMLHMVSVDEGKTFGQPQTISEDNWVIYGCPHTGPSQTSNEKGMHFAWFTGGAVKGTFYNNSSVKGVGFSKRDSISVRGMHPQIATLNDGNLAIAWDEPVDTSGKQVCLEIRNGKGDPLTRKMISLSGDQSSYPVISPGKNNDLLVAFTVKSGKKSSVKFSKVQIGVHP
jgi:hypothetical protein